MAVSPFLSLSFFCWGGVMISPSDCCCHCCCCCAHLCIGRPGDDRSADSLLFIIDLLCHANRLDRRSLIGILMYGINSFVWYYSVILVQCFAEALSNAPFLYILLPRSQTLLSFLKWSKSSPGFLKVFLRQHLLPFLELNIKEKCLKLGISHFPVCS